MFKILTGRRSETAGHEDLSVVFGHASKYLLRLLRLLRKSIASIAVLAHCGEISASYLLNSQSVLLALMGNLTSLEKRHPSLLVQLPQEFFKIFVVCLWDLSLSWKGLIDESKLVIVAVDCVLEMVRVVEVYEHSKALSNKDGIMSDTAVSILSLIAFNSRFDSSAKKEVAFMIRRCCDACLQRVFLRKDSSNSISDETGDESRTFYAVERSSEVRATSHATYRPPVEDKDLFGSPYVLPHRSTSDADGQQQPQQQQVLLPVPTLGDDFLLFCSIKIISQCIVLLEEGDDKEIDFLAIARLGLLIWRCGLRDLSSLLWGSSRGTTAIGSIIIALEGIREVTEANFHSTVEVLCEVRLAILVTHCLRILRTLLASRLPSSLSSTVLAAIQSADEIFGFHLRSDGFFTAFTSLINTSNSDETTSWREFVGAVLLLHSQTVTIIDTTYSSRSDGDCRSFEVPFVFNAKRILRWERATSQTAGSEDRSNVWDGEMDQEEFLNLLKKLVRSHDVLPIVQSFSEDDQKNAISAKSGKRKRFLNGETISKRRRRMYQPLHLKFK